MFGTGAVVRVALMHLAPTLGAVDHNRELLIGATRVAAAAGADWVVSGELVVCGYHFEPVIGVDWIRPQPDEWMAAYARMAADLGVVAFLHAPDLDPATGNIYSSMVAIDRRGEIVGRHRKISVIPGSEDWTTRGRDAEVYDVEGVRVGMLVCADAYLDEPARRIEQAGAEVIVSAAAWHPGEWGPAGEWEQRSDETGLPVVVCNRTGVDAATSFDRAESVVAYRGRRELTFVARDSTVFIVELRRGADGFTFCELDALPLTGRR